MPSVDELYGGTATAPRGRSVDDLYGAPSAPQGKSVDELYGPKPTASAPVPSALANDAIQSHLNPPTGIRGAVNSFISGEGGGALKLLQGTESVVGLMNGQAGAEMAGAPSQRIFTPERVRGMTRTLEDVFPSAPTTLNKVSRFAGEAAPMVGAALVAPEAAVPILTAQGAVGGAASAEDIAMNAREAGHPVSPLREKLGVAGGAVLGGAVNFATGEAMGGINKIAPGPVGRIVGQGLLGIPQTEAQNVQQNLTEKIVNPSAEWQQPTLKDFGKNALINTAFAVGGEMHGLAARSAEPGTGKSVDELYGAKTEPPKGKTVDELYGAAGSNTPKEPETSAAPIRPKEEATPIPQRSAQDQTSIAQESPNTSAGNIATQTVKAPQEIGKPPLFSENGAEKATRILDPRSRLGVNEDVWASNNRDLAHGQGENQGVTIEFDPEKVRTTISSDKPGGAFQEQHGNFEHRVLGQSDELAPSVRSVTIDSEKATGPFAGRLKGILYRQGFTDIATNEDGTITYRKAQGAAEPPTSVEPTEPIQTQERAAQGQEKSPEALTPTEQGPKLPVGVGPASPEDPAFSKMETPTGIRNKIVDQQRESRGLSPAMQAGKKSFGDVWDSAMKEIDQNPQLQDDLLSELRNKPRALTDREDALVLHRQVDLQNQFDGEAKALEQAQGAGDKEGVAEHRVRVNALSDQLLDVYNIGKSSGTETGRGLNARKMLAQEDFTLARMETLKRAVNSGKRLTPEQQTEVRGQQQKIAKAQQDLEAYTAKVEKRKADILTKRIAILEQKVKAGDISTRQSGATVENENITKLKAQRDDLQGQLDAMRGDTSKLKAFKTRSGGQITNIQGKLEAGDFSKPGQRAELKLDPEGQSLKAQLERYKQQFQEGLMRDRLKNRTLPEKVQDTFVKWRRAFLLSSPVTLAKLTSAAAERMAFTPGEEAIGGVIGKVIPKVAAKAAREGGVSVTAEAKALTEGFTKGMADAWKTLRTGKSDLDTLYGKKGGVPQSLIDLIGNVHGALKAPTKRAEFARSFQKRAETAISQGLDASDPLVQTRLAVDAYKDSQRSIFMQDNRVVSAYKRAISALEQPSKLTGKTPPGAKALATAGKVLLPIVKVPTNIVAETLDYAFGSVTGSARAIKAYAVDGVKNLPPEQADVIMRSLKKGSLGAAVLALGYFNADKIGGYYQPGKQRDEKDVKFGAVRVMGHDVPSYLVHNPLLEMMQIGATVRRVSDSFRIKADEQRGQPQGIGEGVLAAALGVTEQVPFVREMTELDKLRDPRTRDTAAGEFVRDLAVPQAVQFAAQQSDKDAQGNPIPRKAKGITQNLKMGIPGLRQQVANIPQDKAAWDALDADRAVDLYESVKPDKRDEIAARVRNKIVSSKLDTDVKRGLFDRFDAATQ